MDSSIIERTLGKCELFQGLGQEYIKQIAGSSHLEERAPGESLFRQGDLGGELFVVAAGLVHLERTVDLGTRKGRALIGMFGPGRVLGCWSTLLGEPHHLMSSAVCQRPTTVVVLPGIALRALLLANQDLGFMVLERLCFLLRDRLQGAYGAMEKI